jgi:hypothetical protein
VRFVRWLSVREAKIKKESLPKTTQAHSMRNARMGSMDAARCAGKNAAARVTMVMPANATTIVRGSPELKPYSIERKVVATARDAGMPMTRPTAASLAPKSTVRGNLTVDSFYHPVHSIGGDFAVVNWHDQDQVSLLMTE